MPTRSALWFLFALGVVLAPMCAAFAADGLFEPPVVIDGAFATPTFVHVADINGDAHLDVLAVGAEGQDEVAWWENAAGDGLAWIKHTIDSSFDSGRSIHAGDLDGDGDIDAVAAACHSNEIAWWRNLTGNGSAWTKTIVASNYSCAHSAFALDVDGDNDLDIAGAAFVGGVITWWENSSGDGSTWVEHPVGACPNAFDVSSADLDGDGDSDILGVSNSSLSVSWWENTNGDGSTWDVHPIAAGFSGSMDARAVDIDGDGDLDVLCTAGSLAAFSRTSWWENTNADGLSWIEHIVDQQLHGHSVRAADFDRDGDQDVVVAGGTDGTISWFENIDVIGTNWNRRSVQDTIDFPVAVDVGDIDGDSWPDIVGTSLDDDFIAWWRNDTTVPVELMSFTVD